MTLFSWFESLFDTFRSLCYVTQYLFIPDGMVGWMGCIILYLFLAPNAEKANVKNSFMISGMNRTKKKKKKLKKGRRLNV